MGCVISAIKSFFGIGNEDMWREVFERKIMADEIGLSFRLWTNTRKDDTLWELESAMKSLSCDNLNREKYPNFTDKIIDEIVESKSSCRSEENNENRNMNESSCNNTSHDFVAPWNDGIRFRHHSNERDNTGQQDMNKFPNLNYVFDEHSQSNFESKFLYSEDQLIDLLGPLSDYGCNFNDTSLENVSGHFDEQMLEEDSYLINMFSEISKYLNETNNVESVEDVNCDDYEMRELCDLISETIISEDETPINPMNPDNKHLLVHDDKNHMKSMHYKTSLITKESLDNRKMFEENIINVSDINEDNTLAAQYGNRDDFSLEFERNDECSLSIEEVFSSLSIDDVHMRQNRNSHMANNNGSDGSVSEDTNSSDVFFDAVEVSSDENLDNISKDTPKIDESKALSAWHTLRLNLKNILPRKNDDALPTSSYENHDNISKDTQKIDDALPTSSDEKHDNISKDTQKIDDALPTSSDEKHDNISKDTQKIDDALPTSSDEKHDNISKDNQKIDDALPTSSDEKHDNISKDTQKIDDALPTSSDEKHDNISKDTQKIDESDTSRLEMKNILPRKSDEQKETLPPPIEDVDVEGYSNNTEITHADNKNRGVIGRVWGPLHVKLKNIIFQDATPVDNERSVHRADLKGMDICMSKFSQRRKEVPKVEPNLAEKPEDFEEFLEKIKFDIHKQPNSRLIGPIQKLKSYFGLNRIKLPKNTPQTHSCFYKFSETAIKILKIVFAPCIALYRRSPDLSTFIGRRRVQKQDFFLRGVMAYKFYKMLTSIERACLTDELLAERKSLMEYYKRKHDILMIVTKLAKNYYQDPSETNRYQWKVLKQRLSGQHHSNIDIQFNISAPPRRWPVFTYTIVIIQAAMLLIMLSTHGTAHFGFRDKLGVGNNIPTFIGHETISYRGPSNPWLGPSPTNLIDFGAIFAPCIDSGSDFQIQMNHANRVRLDRKEKIGCCEMLFPEHDAGSTTEDECRIMTIGRGKWSKGIPCNKKSSLVKTVDHLFKPCCYGLLGHCVLASSEFCEFIGGKRHEECESCNQINCLADICTMWTRHTGFDYDPEAPWLPSPATSWQQYRVLVALVLSPGVLHLAVLATVELIIMAALERAIGWHRIGLIYISSGLIGALFHLAFQSEIPAVNSTAGVSGVIGAACLELFQALKMMDHPIKETLKVFSLIVMFIVLGTLPLISITAILGGLVTGFISGLMLLPYITFGGNLSYWRGRIVLFACCLMILLCSSLIHLAFTVAPYNYCDFCSLIECVPYTDYVCVKEHGGSESNPSIERVSMRK